jgi:hypothetical protein
MIQVVATAANSEGSGSATSDQTPAVTGAPLKTAPVIASGPTISGPPREGQTLTADSSWSGNPTPTVTYQWRRCSSATACATISGVTGSSYVLVRADVGSMIEVVATAANSEGTGSATSNQTSAVTGAPLIASGPTISGTPREGQTLRQAAAGRGTRRRPSPTSGGAVAAPPLARRSRA